MRKRNSILGAVFAVVFSSCQQPKPYSFKELSCPYAEPPTLNGGKISSLDNLAGKAKGNTLREEEIRSRHIFKPCRQYIYRAQFKAPDGKLLSDSRVWLMATGRAWPAQPEVQDEVALQFEVRVEEQVELRKHFVNRKFAALDRISTQETTGVIENNQEVWMHPFRANQFDFTEVAGFPEVQLPLEIGKTWTSYIHPGKGWGDWENTTVTSVYRVKKREKLKTAFQEFENCWKIACVSTAPFGDSKHDFWFDAHYGFVRMEYTNYQGQTLAFDLEEVIEK